MMRTLFAIVLGAALAAACGSQPAETDLAVDDTPRPILSAKPSDAELHRRLTPLQLSHCVQLPISFTKNAS